MNLTAAEVPEALGETLTSVRVSVLAHHTPIAIRRAIAGNAQRHQHAILTLKMSEIASVFLTAQADGLTLSAAITQSGVQLSESKTAEKQVCL